MAFARRRWTLYDHGMKNAPTTAATLLRKLRVRDIPRSWNVPLPDDPDTPVMVAITPSSGSSRRPLTSFIGAGAGLYGSTAEVDGYVRDGRDEWET